jgi:hypothetical protein
MPLLPESLASILETDRAVALAAAVHIGRHHADVLAWVWGMVGAGVAEPRKPRRPRKPHARKTNGVDRQPPSGKADSGFGAYHARRRAARDQADKALVEAMKAAPEGSIKDWASAISRSAGSVATALHRLRDADRAESVEGRWRLVEEPAPKATRRWVEPVKATDRASHAHLHASG